MVRTAAYGTWQSPISVDDVAAEGGRPDWLAVHDDAVWWTQSLPAEGGRLTLVVAEGADEPRELLPAPWNVRNRVQEYGGRPWVLLPRSDGQLVAFTNWADQRMYVFDPAAAEPAPVPITPTPEKKHGWRYADLVAGAGGDEVWCVRETVTGDKPTDIRRELVAIPVSGAAVNNADEIRIIANSHHFLTAPKPSPNGRHIAWLGWNHPAMPWDGTQLCIAESGGKSTVGNGKNTAEYGGKNTVENYRVVAGGPRESVCQFEWEDDDNILALTDPEGWWNLHRIQLNSDSADSVSTTNLAPCAEEIGGPLWRAGTSWFAPLGANQPGRFIVLRSGNLAVLDEKSGTVTDVKTEFTSWFSVYSDNGVVAALANNATSPTTVVTVEIDDTNKCTTVRALTTPHTLPAEYLPRPESRTFTDKDGNKIPAYVYPPKNPEFTGEDGELPPYLIHVHGGPTGREFGDFDAGFAYFTSRGIGVVAVNYGGSVGYGRQFRERLLGQWGVVDVDDCAAVASALADEGTADRRRLAIRGGSAGGWTSAASLTSVDVYACGTVLYPILDLRGWTADGGETHDFESRYIEGLVGELPTYARRYHDRSPINNVDKLAGPVLLLQGLDDQICPPVQAERFIKALAGKGIAHAYLAFDGEQHGFRKAETIRAAFEAELSFYGQVFGFEPPGVPKLPLNT